MSHLTCLKWFHRWKFELLGLLAGLLLGGGTIMAFARLHPRFARGLALAAPLCYVASLCLLRRNHGKTCGELSEKVRQLENDPNSVFHVQKTALDEKILSLENALRESATPLEEATAELAEQKESLRRAEQKIREHESALTKTRHELAQVKSDKVKCAAEAKELVGKCQTLRDQLQKCAERTERLQKQDEAHLSALKQYDDQIRNYENQKLAMIEDHRRKQEQAEAGHRMELDEFAQKAEEDMRELQARQREELAAVQASMREYWPMEESCAVLNPLMGVLRREIEQSNCTYEARDLYLRLWRAFLDSSPANQIASNCFELSRCLYAWLGVTVLPESEASDLEQALFGWISTKLANLGMTVRLVKQGDSFSHILHDAGSQSGGTITTPLSFLIFRNDAKPFKLALVRVQ